MLVTAISNKRHFQPIGESDHVPVCINIGITQHAATFSLTFQASEQYIERSEASSTAQMFDRRRVSANIRRVPAVNKREKLAQRRIRLNDTTFPVDISDSEV